MWGGGSLGAAGGGADGWRGNGIGGERLMGCLRGLNLVQGLLHDGPWLHIIVHCRGSKGGGLNESPERMGKYIQVPQLP